MKPEGVDADSWGTANPGQASNGDAQTGSGDDHQTRPLVR